MPKRKRGEEAPAALDGGGVGAASSANDGTSTKTSASGVLTGTASARKGHYEVDCPYLDTIDRTLLDFDFQKVCSVTLSNQNVYTCLVCGKFFKGKAPKTPAFTHSVQW